MVYVTHYGYVADGLHYEGMVSSTRKLALVAARTMATEGLYDDEQEIVVVEHDECVVATGLDCDDEEVEVRVMITELSVDGKSFYGSIDD